MEPKHLKRLIETVLDEATQVSGKPLNSISAINLLMGTAAQESKMGRYLYQLGKGPARGIFQIEPATEEDILNRFVMHSHSMQEVMEHLGICNSEFNLAGNLNYQIIIARLKYWSIPEKLPEADDIDGLARYWKKYYNTELGKGTVKEFKENYRRYCG